MKVLFAVSNEEISESIVKKYQKEYKQIISYKNVYYFNAILKELQKDKTYDRIVISEDLEAFTSTQYEQIDKFIFEKLDSISDEASNVRGNDTPIILICSDRRAKSEQMLVKLFGIGIYNAIIGNDRSVDEVCRLINRPRVKKEAKSYYKIDTEEVNYQAENENDVSEMEIQNIIAHYKRLGKNEDRYIDSFNNIAAQYNDTQLRIISKFLPLNVRAVLEEKSPKYQQIMSFNNTVSDSLRKDKNDKDNGPSEIFLKSKNRENIMSRPVVIPSAVNMGGTKKLARQKPVSNHQETYVQANYEQQNPIQQAHNNRQSSSMSYVENKQQTVPQSVRPEPIIEEFENLEQKQENEEKDIVQEVAQPVKRGRGRPRKNPVPTETTNQPVKRKRGRPRKNPIPEVQEKPEEEFVLPGLEPQEQEPKENFLPGWNDEETQIPQTVSVNQMQEEAFLPGFDEESEEDDMVLPGLEKQEPEYEEPVVPQSNTSISNNYEINSYSSNHYDANPYDSNSMNVNKGEQENYEEIDLSNLLTPDRKIVTFVGTSKNGTSFIVNNIAELMSSIGINTAILDTTQNRNSYYIYTKNEEPLREIATHSIQGLAMRNSKWN